jgi:hypothetical protein
MRMQLKYNGWLDVIFTISVDAQLHEKLPWQRMGK